MIPGSSGAHEYMVGVGHRSDGTLLLWAMVFSSCNVKIIILILYLVLNHVWRKTKGDNTNVQELHIRQIPVEVSP